MKTHLLGRRRLDIFTPTTQHLLCGIHSDKKGWTGVLPRRVHQTRKPATIRGLSRGYAELCKDGSRTQNRSWTARMHHPYAADALVGSMQVLAEHAYYLHANLWMLAQKFHELFPANEYDLRGIQQFRRNLVRRVGQRGPQPQHFPRARHSQRKTLPTVRTDGELGAAV